MKFKDLKLEEFEGVEKNCYASESVPDPVHGSYDLPHGCWVSVVRHKFSYGGEKGLYEIGFFSHLRMTTPDFEDWGDTVKGWLKEEDVEFEINRLEKSLKADTLKFKQRW